METRLKVQIYLPTLQNYPISEIAFPNDSLARTDTSWEIHALILVENLIIQLHRLRTIDSNPTIYNF